MRFLMGESAEKIHKVVDATVAPPQGFNEEDKYFDVMSWDPRGVNNTTPQVICFPDISARENWVRSMSAEGTMMSSDVAFFTKWARYMAISGACTERMASVEDGEDNLLEHVNTAPVVGDMVAIIEALGEWREKEALRVLDGHANMEKLEQNEFFASAESQAVLKERRQTSSERETVIERTKWKKGEEKLLYWGFSYGTALGATFSAIQPHRVGRVILDGVVDGRDYYSLKFEKNLIDNDAVSSQDFSLHVSFLTCDPGLLNLLRLLRARWSGKLRFFHQQIRNRSGPEIQIRYNPPKSPKATSIGTSFYFATIALDTRHNHLLRPPNPHPRIPVFPHKKLAQPCNNPLRPLPRKWHFPLPSQSSRIPIPRRSALSMHRMRRSLLANVSRTKIRKRSGNERSGVVRGWVSGPYH